MVVPSVKIGLDGALVQSSQGARELFAQPPGVYRVMRTGSVLILALDEGTGAGPREGEALTLSGDLSQMELLGLLNLLNQNRESGRLVVKQGKIERVIMLNGGDVASIGSNAPQDRLGRFLVRLGKITEAELQTALDNGGSGRLGQTLLALGVLDAHTLWASIQVQITDIFADVVQWNEGSFLLFHLPEGHRWPSTPPMQMQGLLLESVRRADEMSRYRERISSTAQRVERTENLPNESLDPNVRRAYDQLTAEQSLADLAARLHVSEFEITRLAYLLLKEKLIALVETKVEQIPFELNPNDRTRVEVFNLAFREIRDEVVRSGGLEAFMTGLIKYLSDHDAPHFSVFHGVLPDATGAFPVDTMVKNFSNLDVNDKRAVFFEALNDLTFFMLFQCGELLDAERDENLGRRVRLIHSALAGY